LYPSILFKSFIRSECSLIESYGSFKCGIIFSNNNSLI
jgi:hypothetical protein